MDSQEVAVQENPFGFCPDSLSCVEGKVKNGQFFSNLLTSLGMSAQEGYNLTMACGDVFDVKNLRVGNSYKAYYDEKGILRHIVYDASRTSNIIFDCQSPYSVRKYEKPISVEQRYADVTISSSLWVDMRDAGVSPELIISLSDIYAWTVDFFGLQKGDRFRVLYEEKICDGEVVAVDTVRYATFTRGSEVLPSIMFDQKDGGNIYWNEKGESMRKAFLKAPLKFSRISSGFSYSRKHPVTRKVQPHTGIDYAAPKGTPVMTIGDGVVTSMKYEGAGGNTIRIRHNSVYSTAYLHLSGYAKGLKVGQRVRQGQVIGYVGSTGRSTGPHLDFRVWRNGTPINPLKMDSPPAEPLKDEFKAAFEQTQKKYRAQVDSIRARDIVNELFDRL
jgi:murein DD-endopeptidase MepM/ murein hydrolase activator NlpD